MAHVFVVALIVAAIAASLALEDDAECANKRHFRGCWATLGKCRCSRTRACSNPFPYRSKNECRGDIRGMNDKCANSPCVNGECTQTKVRGYRSWYCECAGSGYYGYRCELECPRHKDPSSPDYPVPCIMLEDKEPELTAES